MIAALAMAVEVARLPRYRASDAFVFSDGRVERVIRVQGDRITWRGLTGQTYVRSRNFVVPVLQWRSGKGAGQRKIVGSPQKLWPVGDAQSVRFRAVAQTKVKPTASWRRAATLWTCKSLKPRSISIVLGEFRTYPFACDRFSATTMRLIERLEWDYAPEVNHYVRRSSVDYFRGTRSTTELVAALSGPAASQRRLAALARAAREQVATSKRPSTQNPR